jgi:phage internal scaffolding protein
MEEAIMEATIRDNKEIIRLQNGRVRVRTINKQPSKTDTQFKDEVDVNNIMRKFQRTGQISHLAKRDGTYMDVSEIKDLAESIEVVDKAAYAFEKLPAKIRNRFDNDPRKLVTFMQDEKKNLEEMYELGLKQKPSRQKPLSETTPPATDATQNVSDTTVSEKS